MKMQNPKFDDEKQSPQITNAMTQLDEKCEFVNLPTKKRIPNTVPPSMAFIKFILNRKMCRNQNLLTKKQNVQDANMEIRNAEKCKNRDLLTKTKAPRIATTKPQSSESA